MKKKVFSSLSGRNPEKEQRKMNLRKLRKAVSGLIAGLVMLSPCRRESDSLPEADLRQEICSQMGYRYTKEGWDTM